MNRLAIRIPLFALVFVAILVFPWYLSAVILLGLTIYFPFYLEALFFAFLIDTLYSSSYSFPYFGLSLATVFLLLIMFVKTRIRI